MGVQRCEEELVTTRNTFDPEPVKEFKRRALARQETVNVRLKTCDILEERFRTMGPNINGISREEKHGVVFGAVIVITQYQMENGRGPLFAV